MKNYPNNIETIEGVRQLSKRIGVSRITLTTWIKNYLIHKKGPVISKIVYNNIWSNRTGQFPYGYKVTHDRIKEYVINRNGNLITSETDYLKMRGRPNVKFIEIICSKNHYFSARLDRLLYEGTWCPICSEYKTQRVMRIYMEQIFGVTFRETSFHKAYNLTAKNNRRLRWDGYNGSVKVNNRMFRIAFEYDGIQHDIFPNPYHKNKEEFLKQIKNDRKKDNIALESDKRTTVIRLKAIQGYDFTTTHMFEKEIINQFFQATGILLEFKGYLFDIGTFTLKEKPKNLERFLENGGPGAI